MKKDYSSPTAFAWITFIGLVFLLLGIYATIRTVVNIALFEKYPTTGVVTFNLSGLPPYFPREQDCYYPFTPQPVPVDPSLSESPSTGDAKSQQDQQQKICLEGVKEARDMVKVNDITQSALFLFLGVGILASRKKLFSHL